MQLLSGNDIASGIFNRLKKESALLEHKGIKPSLAVILVGDDPASAIYVSKKRQMCEKLGIVSLVKKLPANITQAEFDEVLNALNEDDSIHGILCQSPLPSHLDENKAIITINPQKDVDCFHPLNIGLMTMGKPRFMPCTPFGVVQILKKSSIEISGKNIAVIGRSHIVGRPLSIMLSLSGFDATVTLCHSKTADLERICSQADILVAALGKPRFVKESFIKQGATVIDVGINRVSASSEKGYEIVGDVDFDACLKKASAATPVPGGVGPLTIQMLMYNTLNAARFKHGMDKIDL